jgi:hypothetical protein
MQRTWNFTSTPVGRITHKMLFKITRVIVFCWPKLDPTSFDNGYYKTEELVCSAINDERVCNSSARAFRTQFHSAGCSM